MSDFDFIIVDFDGTLIKGNSFHYWIFFLIIFSWEWTGVRLYFRKMLFLLGIIVKRYRGDITHHVFKRRIQNSFHLDENLNINSRFSKRFCKFLKSKMRSKLYKYIVQERKKGARIILATAAPDDYIIPFANLCDCFDYVLATPLASKPFWQDNIREIKYDNVVGLMDKIFEAAYTFEMHSDHEDDILLLEKATRAVLYPPILDHISSDKIFKLNAIHYDEGLS